jgi:hypothetical protein
MVITLQVPTKAQMGYGLGKCIQYGVEYEVLDNLQVQLTSADEMKLTKMAVAFQGKLLDKKQTEYVSGDLPKYEVQYARTHRPIKTTRRFTGAPQDNR